MFQWGRKIINDGQVNILWGHLVISAMEKNKAGKGEVEGIEVLSKVVTKASPRR